MSVALLIGAGAFAAAALLAYVLGHRLDRREAQLVLLIAQVNGVLAMFVGERPTAITWMNVVLAALLGALVPLAASRATPIACLIAASLATFATLFPLNVSLAPAALACAALGVSIAIVATGARAPIVRAVVGALLVHACLRFTWPTTVGTSAALSALVLAPVVIVGWWRAPSRYKRWSLAGVGACVVLAAGATAGAALTVVKARDQLSAGVNAAERGLDAVSAGHRDAATPALEEARSQFNSIEAKLKGPFAQPALLVPVLSQHVRTARDVAAGGVKVLDAAIEANTAADPAKVKLVDGAISLTAVKSLQTPLVDLSASLMSMARTLDRTRSPWLAGPLVEKLDELDEKVTKASTNANTALDAVQQAPALLGEKATRRYFVAVMTPSEMRGSGGLLGSFGVVEAKGGKVNLVRVGRDADLVTEGLPVAKRTLTGAPEDWIAQYKNVQPEKWLNLTYGPDWAATSTAISVLYPQSGGEAVDGVIGIDPYAMAAILKLTGPIKVPDWPDAITADNAVQIMLFDQYAKFQANTDRVGFLGEVAFEMWTALLKVNPEPTKFADVFGPAARSGHLKMWAKTPAEQALLVDLKASGTMPAVTSDFVAVIGNSASANKIDWFTRRMSSYEATVDPRTGDVEATVTVKVTNTAPASGLPDYILGAVGRTPTSPGYAHVYEDVSIYSPLAAASITVDGQSQGLRTAKELNRNVVTTFVDVAPGKTVVVEAKLKGRISLKDGYGLMVFRQPLVESEQVTARVTFGDRFASVTFPADQQTTTWTFPAEREERLGFLDRVRIGHF